MGFYEDREQIEPILASAHDAALQFLHGLAERPVGHSLQPLPPDTLPEEGLGAQAALSAFRNKYEAQLSGSAGPRYLEGCN